MSSSEFDKFIYAQTRLSNDGAESTAIKFFMIRHNDLPKRFITTKNHVTTFLSFQVEANFLEGFRAFLP